MIEIFTDNLPYKLRDQILIEYSRRMSDINYLISGRFSFYTPLKDDKKTIELLLAMSIFYKRIITNFDSASKFSTRIITNSSATSIQLGTFEISNTELLQINRTILRFKGLLHEYSIPLELFEYIETKEFLRNIKIYKWRLTRETDGESF